MQESIPTYSNLPGDPAIFQAILSHIPDSVIVIDRNYKVICYNDIARDTLRPIHKRDIKAGDDHREFVVAENMPIYLQSFEKALNGETVIVEKEISTEGKKVWLRFRLTPVFDEQRNVVALTFIATDIDQGKRKEVALRQSQQDLETKTKQLEASEKYFRTLIETSSDAIVLIDATGKVYYQTPSTEKISGYTLEEIQNLDGRELIHPDDRSDTEASFRELVTTPGAIQHKKHRFRRKNGHYIWIEGTYRNLLQDENVNAIVYSYSDVTEKILVSEKLNRYNREVTLLNRINDIILHATDENSLYHEVCKCIVDSGGYKLAWICYYPEGNDEGELVVSPLAAHGATEYLDEARISLSDPELSKGPTATAFLTGEKVVTNNVHHAEHFKPWILLANKFGMSASIALPLKLSSNNSGTLNIYSAEPDAFEMHEVTILDRLANNLSLAVQGIRTTKDVLHTKHLLNERVKEISTIYHVHNILQDVEQSVEDVFNKIVNILPPGWQYPEVCEARIEFNGKTFSTAGYQPSDLSQRAKIETQDGRKGAIEVVYTREMKEEYEGPFLKEERDLINTIAEIIQVYFNKKSSQDALANSEARFRGAFEYAAIGMAIVSLTGQWIMVNKELCDMTGYTEAELLSTTFQQITHPDDKANDIAPVQELISGVRDFYRREKRYIHKNGSVVWVNLNSAVIKDRYAQPQYFVTQIENVTARKESELKFRDLVEKSLVGVYIIQNEKFAYVNPRIIEESGYTEEELTSMTIDKFVHRDDLELVHKNISGRVKGELDEARYEVRAFKKNGELMWLEMFGSGTIYVGGPAIIGTMVNITGKKAVYNELIKSEANLKSIFDNTQIGYLLLDEQYKIVVSNQYYQDGYAGQTGYVLQPGTSFLELVMPDKRELVKNALDTVKVTAKAFEYETCYANKEPVKYFNVTFSPVLSNGAIIGYCVAGYDITNRKNMEKERQKIVADLISRNRDLQEFAQIVSHNLRGPLATILGLTNMFKGGVTEPEKDFILEGIGMSAEKLDSVVRELNNILDAKSDSTETRVSVQLDGLVEEVKVSFANLIENTGAKIECDFSGISELFTLRSFMFNILYSLISNSLKYSDKNRAPYIKIWTEQHIGEVQITISDNGVGIDMKKHGDQLFLLNKRFQNTTEGKGLGLFLVKAQVEVLNGSIEIDSEPGIGTTVRIKLPV